VKVRHQDGSYTRLSSHEYTLYDFQPGDTSDFSEFEHDLTNVDVLPCWDLLLDALDQWGADHVKVLTARTYPDPVRTWLRWMGVEGVHVEARASLDEKSKANWIRSQIKRSQPDTVIFFEDNERWLKAVRDLQGEFPKVPIFTHWIQNGSIE
jgi:hypothetical protein